MTIFGTRHYKAIAEVIAKKSRANKKKLQRMGGSSAIWMRRKARKDAVRLNIESFSWDLGCMFLHDNPNFNREKFLKACGMEE